MGGVRFFGGHCAWVARWTGGGSDPGEIWRVVRLSKDLSACPRSGGRVLARSGHDLVGALACQHRECIVCRLPFLAGTPFGKTVVHGEVGRVRGSGCCFRWG